MRIAALIATAVLLASCSGSGDALQDPSAAPTASASAGVPAGLEPYYSQQLRWPACGGDFECTTLRVPRDYGNPSGGDFDLEVIRLPAEGADRIGALVVNPGGPGGSGVAYARAARAIVSPDVLRAYDIVGFDPRGVGGSDPVDCLDGPELDALIAADPTPDDQQEVDALLSLASSVGRQCEQRSGDIFRWMDTVSAAKDMDVLRAALGQRRLDYLGKSYGTSLGAAYAEQFPEHVGRFVLDGAFPLDMSSQEVSRDQAIGFETALQRFVADCLPRRDCPLAGPSVAAGTAQVRDFLAGLEANPLPAEGGRTLSQALGVTAILYYLYFPPNDWELLRQGLAAGLGGDGSVLLTMLDQRLQRDPATGEYADNSQEAFYAVSCLDRSAASVAEIGRLAASWAEAAPTFGPYLAWSDAVCAQWPVPPVSQPRTVAAEGAGPILVVSTQYDPATPYAWGQRMAAGFDDAVLVSYNGDGHTAYGNGSQCVDGAVDRFLLTGEAPAADPRCGY